MATSSVGVWMGGGMGRRMETYVNILWLLWWWSAGTDHCESLSSKLWLR